MSSNINPGKAITRAVGISDTSGVGRIVSDVISIGSIVGAPAGVYDLASGKAFSDPATAQAKKAAQNAAGSLSNSPIEAPKLESKAVQAEADAKMAASRAKANRRSTIRTGSRGVLAAAPIARASLGGKSLLGA